MRTRLKWVGLLWLLGFGWLASATSQEIDSLPGDLARRLESAGEHRPELEQALSLAQDTERRPLEYLIAYLPDRDLSLVSGAKLLEEVRLALKVRHTTEWQRQVPEALFLNDVLPYANLDEPRDAWRAEFYEKFWPLVREARSATEAAQILNERVFQILNVKYSTGRKRANQSPKESVEQGVASCSGLSIILVNACRSVGIPARIAGIPKWPNKSGNHTWVEIWDGAWHFTGACEYNPEGLDKTWFNADAALADPARELHSIYAISYKPTGQHFPLAWAPRDRTLHAVNVTDRYVPHKPETDPEAVRYLIRIWDSGRSRRIKAKLTVVDANQPTKQWSDESRDESADTNDIASFQLRRKGSYRLQVDIAGNSWQFPFQAADAVQQAVELSLPDLFVQPGDKNQLSSAEVDLVKKGAGRLLSEPASALSADELNTIDQLLKDNPKQVRQLVWEVYLAWAREQSANREDFEQNQVRFQEHLSPYSVREIGQKPDSGWPLVIAMHGGGNAPQELNDSQWKIMQRYYRDHPEISGYKYLALRAPNNTWNGFYDNYVYPLIENLIAQFLVFGEVDPNKVFIMGYSHGGYGAFAIGPKMPDRFAAIHASAAAPTDGETSAKTLRTTRMTYMIGERDVAYGRRERCEAFSTKLDELRAGRLDIYPVEMLFQAGHGHGGLPDRDMLQQMLPFERNPRPQEVDWELTDPVIRNLYWLAVDEPGKNRSLAGRITSQSVEIQSENVASGTIFLDERQLLLDQPVALRVNDQASTTVQPRPSFQTLCETLRVRRDIELAYPVRIQVDLQKGTILGGDIDSKR